MKSLFKKTITAALFPVCLERLPKAIFIYRGRARCPHRAVPFPIRIFLIAISIILTANIHAAEQIYSTVKDASFALTAIVQTPDGGTDKVRITNKDILTELNATGAFNFGHDAKLLLRSVNGALPYFVVRESITNEIDVSDYLILTEPDDAVHGRNSVVNWGIWNYTLNGTDGTDFTIWTLTTLHTGAIPTGNGGNLLRTVNLASPGSGPGHVDGANAQFTGKVTANHARLD
jgi:hypothetical protein